LYNICNSITDNTYDGTLFPHRGDDTRVVTRAEVSIRGLSTVKPRL
jgi:hypothetical protein